MDTEAGIRSMLCKHTSNAGLRRIFFGKLWRNSDLFFKLLSFYSFSELLMCCVLIQLSILQFRCRIRQESSYVSYSTDFSTSYRITLKAWFPLYGQMAESFKSSCFSLFTIYFTLHESIALAYTKWLWKLKVYNGSSLRWIEMQGMEILISYYILLKFRITRSMYALITVEYISLLYCYY